MVLKDVNVQKNLVKRDGLVVDGRKYFFKFIGKFLMVFLYYIARLLEQIKNWSGYSILSNGSHSINTTIGYSIWDTAHILRYFLSFI